MTQEQFFKAGKKLGIPTPVLKWAWNNKPLSSSIAQAVADQYGATQKSGCQTPRPAPKLEPGYWECNGGSWEWVPWV